MENYAVTISILALGFMIIKGRSILFRKRYSDEKKPSTKEVGVGSLQGKNIVTSGEFFPTSETALKNKLIAQKANVMPKMSSETDFLVCGKYPDWMLIEEAKMFGIKIVFVDKASDLFSSENHIKSKSEPAFTSQIPLGV